MSAHLSNAYAFSVDDDIVYPPDYVRRMVTKIEEYRRQAIVGVHCVKLNENQRQEREVAFTRRYMYQFRT